MLSSTIFDCLIYKGYGQRVSERDHKPGGFALELGLKVRACDRFLHVRARVHVHVHGALVLLSYTPTPGGGVWLRPRTCTWRTRTNLAMLTNPHPLTRMWHS